RGAARRLSSRGAARDREPADPRGARQGPADRHRDRRVAHAGARARRAPGRERRALQGHPRYGDTARSAARDHARGARRGARRDPRHVRGDRRSEAGMSALAALGLAARNPAGYGAGSWLAPRRSFASHNPATGMPIAEAGACSIEQYEAVIAAARAASARWQAVPAPRRGELVRRIGEALRRAKDALGTLVTLETGKIKPEGDGEIQEMIDIADFAVGQSRMLYGRTMHSERPHHRMYE